MSRIAICPGSFDPVTRGHEDIIRRAARLFDEVIVVVGANPLKSPIFSADERVELISMVCRDLDNVHVDKFEGLLIDYAREKNAMAIVKGLRAVSDFDYEFQIALTNHKLAPNVETVFLTSNSHNMFLSSSVVRQVAQFGGDITQFVPECIVDMVSQRMQQNYKQQLLEGMSGITE